MKTLLLTQEDVRGVVRHVGLNNLMQESIEQLEQALRTFESDKTQTPMRSGFDYQVPVPGLIEWMPALEVGESATVKLVGYHPENPDTREVPTILSTLLTFDVETGHLSTLADGTFATALRTGAASAVASRALAAPDARVLGLIGCGAQSLTQLHALSTCFDLHQVLIYDIDPNNEASLRERAQTFELSADIEFVSASTAQILAQSDILCTQTSVGVGRGPVFSDGPCKPHLHINAVGSDFPGKIELPLSLLKRSLVVPDFRPQALAEGECQMLEPDQLGPDLDQLVQNPAEFGGWRSALTVFDSTGWALEDHLTIGLLSSHAKSLGLGSQVAIESIPRDPSNPYEGMIQLLDAAGERRRVSR